VSTSLVAPLAKDIADTETGELLAEVNRRLPLELDEYSQRVLKAEVSTLMTPDEGLYVSETLRTDPTNSAPAGIEPSYDAPQSHQRKEVARPISPCSSTDRYDS
jgi:hypothetical protein